MEIIIIHYGMNCELRKIILTSITNEKNYNIEGLFSYLSYKLNNDCEFFISNNYTYNSGYGLSENLFHNTYLNNLKKIVGKNNIIKKWID